MNKSLCIFWILATIVTSKLFAQSDTLFINMHGVASNKENATAYRLVSNTNNQLFLHREYLITNQLVKEFYATSAQATILEGNYTAFNLHGSTIMHGIYHRGFKTGEWYYFFSNSEKIREKQVYARENEYYSYQYDSICQRIECKGAIDKYGKRTGEWIQYHRNSDTIKNIANFFTGKKEGEQFEFYKNGLLKRKELFKNNKLLKGELYTENGKKIKYFPAFVYPQYREFISNYLQKNEACVAEALKLNDFLISVVISKQGEVKEASVKHVKDPISAEKIRAALLKMKKWKPALYENEPVKYTFESTIKLYVPRD